MSAHGIIDHCEHQQEQNLYLVWEEEVDVHVFISFSVAQQCIPFTQNSQLQ